MPLRAVFLDVGETLLSTTVSRFEIYAGVARARGCDVDAERMHALMGSAHRALPPRLGGAHRYSDPWFRAFIRRIYGDELGIGEPALGELSDELFARFEDPTTFQVFPGAEELFATVRARGLVLGIVSNWSARLPRLLARLGWEAHFDFVLASAIVGVEKPEPGIFEEALRRAGVSPGEALHAGDHPRLDLEAARRVGIEGVLVDHSGGPADAGAGNSSPKVDGLGALRSYILNRLERPDQ